VSGLQVSGSGAVSADKVEWGETFAFRDLSAGLPGTRLHAAVLTRTRTRIRTSASGEQRI